MKDTVLILNQNSLAVAKISSENEVSIEGYADPTILRTFLKQIEESDVNVFQHYTMLPDNVLYFSHNSKNNVVVTRYYKPQMHRIAYEKSVFNINYPWIIASFNINISSYGLSLHRMKLAMAVSDKFEDNLQLFKLPVPNVHQNGGYCCFGSVGSRIDKMDTLKKCCDVNFNAFMTSRGNNHYTMPTSASYQVTSNYSNSQLLSLLDNYSKEKVEWWNMKCTSIGTLRGFHNATNV